MAGYSGTPLVAKLGIKKDHQVGLLDAPVGFLAILGDLPEGVQIHHQSRSLRATRRGEERKVAQRLELASKLDVIVYFTDSRLELAKDFSSLVDHLFPAGGLWIAWPKKASGVPTDLTEDRVREIGLRAGLVDNKVCAVDETWSGLRFVIRVKDRPQAKK